MSAVIRLWREHKKKANVVLVFDISGSMNEGGKLVNARAGAVELVSMLDDEDLLSLLCFNNQMRWAAQSRGMKAGRQDARRTLESLIADGGTRLYDSIDTAYQYLLQHPAPKRISAVVVLTDGADTDSHLELPALVARIRSDSEHRPIRVFTIGYGNDARAEVLKEISDVTQAKFYPGKPENIREVFKEIATFF